MSGRAPALLHWLEAAGWAGPGLADGAGGGTHIATEARRSRMAARSGRWKGSWQRMHMVTHLVPHHLGALRPRASDCSWGQRGGHPCAPLAHSWALSPAPPACGSRARGASPVVLHEGNRTDKDHTWEAIFHALHIWKLRLRDGQETQQHTCAITFAQSPEFEQP